MSDNTLLNAGTGGDTVRAVDNSAYTTSTPVTAKTQIVKLDFGGETGEAQATAANPLPVVMQNTAAVAVSISTSTGTQAITTNGMGTVSLYLSSVGTGGSMVIEATVDGTNWVIQTVVTSTGFASTITTTGLYQWTVAGFAQTRIRATALTSGTITGTLIGNQSAYQVVLDPVGQQTMANSTSVAVATDQTTAASTQPSFASVAVTTADRSTGAINATAPSSASYAAGSYNSTLPTLTNGQMGALQLTTKGEQLVSLSNGGTAVAVTAASTQPAFASAALTVADRATGASATTAPSSIMYAGASYTSTQPTVSSGQLVGLQTTSRGALLVSLNSTDNSATAAGFVKLTDGTTAVPVTTGSTASATSAAALNVSLSPNSPIPATTSANQACSNVNLNAVGATVTAVKASAGNLFGFSLINNNAAAVFVEFWNVATGSVTLGTTTPTCVFVIPASGTLTVQPGSLALMNSGTAISVAAVTAYNGSTGGSVTGSIFYK